jgi:hypothetical protein
MRPRVAIGAVATAILALGVWAWWTRPVYETFPSDLGETRRGPAAPMLVFAQAFRQLDSALTPEQRDTLRRTLPDTTAQYHMSVGLYIRNEILRPASGAPLLEFFAARGIQHRDDISGALLDLYGQYLRGQPLDVDGAIRRIPPAPKEFKVLPAAG